MLLNFILVLNLISLTVLNAIVFDPEDLSKYSQDPTTYTKNIKPLDIQLKKRLYKEFMTSYFSPWKITKMPISKKSATWGENYSKMKVYGENYRLITQKWFINVIELSNMDSFDTIRQRAITVRNANLRLFPSDKPIFKDYKRAGEGYPFDYNQNSSVNINSPLFISHYSKDKAWAFVSTSFASGWMITRDIAIVDEDVIRKFKNEDKYFVAVKDDFPIYKSGVFKDYIKLGTIFPLRNKKLAMVIRDNTGKGYISRIDNNKNIVSFPIKFNKNNINNIINQLIDKPYGWGGYLGNRDCSLLTKDALTPFAFPMKRNSYAQLKNGKYISFEGKTNKQKKQYIKKYGVPFLSLIYIKGHIALYLGVKHNEPIIFHNMWGVKTIKDGQQGRFIVGKSVISTLEIGQELKNYDYKHNILSKVKGIVILSK